MGDVTTTKIFGSFLLKVNGRQTGIISEDTFIDWYSARAELLCHDNNVVENIGSQTIGIDSKGNFIDKGYE